MKLIVFGASGRTGQQLIQQALEQGHNVSAFARLPSKITTVHANLRLIAGDVTDPLSVDQALPGHEAVLSGLGSTPSVHSEGIRHIVDAMEKAGVRRIVSVLSVGVLLPSVAPQYAAVAAEHRRVLDVLKNSRTDWIAVCPPNLRAEPARGQVRAVAGAVIENGSSITYADLATFMLQQIDSDQFLRQAVGVAN